MNRINFKKIHILGKYRTKRNQGTKCVLTLFYPGRQPIGKTVVCSVNHTNPMKGGI